MSVLTLFIKPNWLLNILSGNAFRGLQPCIPTGTAPTTQLHVLPTLIASS